MVLPGAEERTRVVPRDDPLSLHWRGWIGTFIADNLSWSRQCPTFTCVRKPWHLKDFPKGYTLVQTFRKNDPTKGDPYLYGYGQKKRFRSPQEFGFHAVWLFHHDYHQNHRCECTLCTHRPQGLIQRVWIGVPGQRCRDEDEPMPEGGGYTRRSGAIVTRATGWGYMTWIVLKRSLIDGKSRSPIKIPANRKFDLSLIRPYREGELVWVVIDTIRPSGREQAAEEEIRFWPAIIVAPPTRSRLSQPAVPQSPSHNYHVELLGVDHPHTVPFEKILSCRAYSLPDVLADQILSPSMPAGIVVTPAFSVFRGFHPLPAPPKAPDDRPPLVPGPSVRLAAEPRSIPRTFENALGPLAVAQRKADYIQERYCGTNAYGELEENSGHGSSERLHYQGVWWGAERLWADDLVRLTCLRGELEDALEAAGLKHNLEDVSPGADKRQLFARVLEFTFELVNRQLCFSAELHELAEDLDDDNDDEPDASAIALARHRARAPTSADGLPSAPFGYRFRRVTPPEALIYLPITLISGRYDPIPTESIPHRALVPLNSVTARMFFDREFDPEDPVGRRVGDALALSGLCADRSGPRVGPEMMVDSVGGRVKILRDSDIWPKKVIFAQWAEAGRPTVGQ